jgi:hypothetical protein
MSAVATFYLLDRSAIPGLVQAAKEKPFEIPAPKPRWPAIGYLRSRFGRQRPNWANLVFPVPNYLQESDLGVSDDWGWSGYVLAFLMGFLDETGTALGTTEYRAESEVVNAAHESTLLITSADKRHLAALDPARLDRAGAERYFSEREYFAEEIWPAIDDGLLLLHRLIAALKENEVLVISIG